MITIVQQPPAYCFSSAVGTVNLRAPQRVNFTLRIDGTEVLKETYFPMSGNNIYVRSLDKVLDAYIPRATLRSTVLFTFQEINSGGSVVDTKSFESVVQYCTARINITATDYTETNFLTLLQREKITIVGATEFLSLLVTAETVVTARAKYDDGTVRTLTLGTITVLNKVHTFNVSPGRFPNPHLIAHYVVTAGPRAIVFYMRKPLFEQPPQFVFLNAFGVKETFTPLGLVRRENKYSPLFGSFGGNYRKHHIDLVREYTANTGILSRLMAEWLEDLFFSKDVFLLGLGGAQEEITILEATVKRTSERTELPAYEFKYRLSTAQQHEYTIEGRQRIFDETFDYTFN